MGDEVLELVEGRSARRERASRRAGSFRRPPIEARQPELIEPKSIFEYLPPGDPVHWLIALKDSLPLALFNPVSGSGGYSYDPRMMLMVWVLALWDGEASSRRIEKKMRTDIRFILLGGGLQPDHATLCRFRRSQGEFFAGLLGKTVQMAADRGLVDMRRACLDGTRLPGNVSQWRSLCKAAEAADAAQEDQKPDPPPPAKPKRPLGDPEAKTLATKRGFVVGYNAQAVVDASSGIALGGCVSSSSSDAAQLDPALDACLQTLGELPEELVADKGYDTPANAQALDELGMTGFVPSHFKRFWNLNEQGRLCCPAGHSPSLTQRYREKGVMCVRQIVKECDACPRRPACRVKTRKTIRTPEGISPETWIAMHLRAASDEGKKAGKERAASVERAFAHLKERMRFRRFSLRGLEGAGFEWLLALIASNLMRMRPGSLLSALLRALRRLYIALTAPSRIDLRPSPLISLPHSAS